MTTIVCMNVDKFDKAQINYQILVFDQGLKWNT